jgi:transposase
MIPHGVEIFVGVEPIDLRWGFDTLAGIVTERISRPPRSGALFVFFGKRRDAIKILFADASGLCVLYKRLERGTFRLPAVHDASVTSLPIDERALDHLLDGIDVSPPPRPTLAPLTVSGNHAAHRRPNDY